MSEQRKSRRLSMKDRMRMDAEWYDKQTDEDLAKIRGVTVEEYKAMDKFMDKYMYKFDSRTMEQPAEAWERYKKENNLEFKKLEV